MEGMAGGSPEARDHELIDQERKTLQEATERVNFHRIETERWERIARGSAAALGELESVTDVPTAEPQHFTGGGTALGKALAAR